MTVSATLRPNASNEVGPRVSVIVPSFNSGTYLREAITSALEQVPPPHEIVVQDGQSSDLTLEILTSFGDRVRWVSEPDRGQSDALNRALQRATGDIVVWLNADDLLMPGALAAATAAFVRDPSLTFVYGDFDRVDGSGSLIRAYQSSPYDWDRVYMYGCYIFSGSLFIRRDHLIEIGGFDESLHGCMDFDLLLRLGPPARSAHLGMTISQFRMHNEAKSSTIGVVFLREALAVRRRYAERSPRLWAVAIWSGLSSVVMQATARLRFSPLWPRHGRTKRL